MKDVIIIAVIALVIGLALYYIIKSKKKGRKCIGCPGGCATTCSACDYCSQDEEKK